MNYLALSVPVLNTTTILSNIISQGLSIFIIIGVIIALEFIIYSEFKWIVSGGNKQLLESTQKTIIFFIGSILIILALVRVKLFSQISEINYF